MISQAYMKELRLIVADHPKLNQRQLYAKFYSRICSVEDFAELYGAMQKENEEMSNPIKEVEDALFVIGRGMEELKRQTFLQLPNLDAAVFDQAWKLAARRESDGTCPCCGNMRGLSGGAKRGAMP